MKTINVTHNSSWVNDLNTGIFLLGDSINREEVITSNGSLVRATRAISCLTLQSLGFYSVGHTNKWKSFNLGKDIIYARMAVDEHDLIALVTTFARPSPRHTHSDFFRLAGDQARIAPSLSSKYSYCNIQLATHIRPRPHKRFS